MLEASGLRRLQQYKCWLKSTGAKKRKQRSYELQHIPDINFYTISCPHLPAAWFILKHGILLLWQDLGRNMRGSFFQK